MQGFTLYTLYTPYRAFVFPAAEISSFPLRVQTPVTCGDPPRFPTGNDLFDFDFSFNFLPLATSSPPRSFCALGLRHWGFLSCTTSV